MSKAEIGPISLTACDTADEAFCAAINSYINEVRLCRRRRYDTVQLQNWQLRRLQPRHPYAATKPHTRPDDKPMQCPEEHQSHEKKKIVVIR